MAHCRVHVRGLTCLCVDVAFPLLPSVSIDEDIPAADCCAPAAPGASAGEPPTPSSLAEDEACFFASIRSLASSHMSISSSGRDSPSSSRSIFPGPLASPHRNRKRPLPRRRERNRGPQQNPTKWERIGRPGSCLLRYLRGSRLSSSSWSCSRTGSRSVLSNACSSTCFPTEGKCTLEVQLFPPYPACKLSLSPGSALFHPQFTFAPLAFVEMGKKSGHQGWQVRTQTDLKIVKLHAPPSLTNLQLGIGWEGGRCLGWGRGKGFYDSLTEHASP